MEQKPYTFRRFNKWFAAIDRRKLVVGDFSIAGLEEGGRAREAFVRACERLGKFDFAAMVIEDSISKILRSNDFSSIHPNAVFGTIQALAVRWGIQPWFAPSRAVAEEITACLLHKAYQLIALEKRDLPLRFVDGDIFRKKELTGPRSVEDNSGQAWGYGYLDSRNNQFFPNVMEVTAQVKR